ncbi:TonB-dependent siderophore receptor [Pseudomonas sp. PDM11]|uniref:TonB-dependent siderophore receptor n=1 Tax=Pseudomonas sp. PDM11 TaxID=2769309 RepID=UPI0017819AC8|nr:TonB-dependent siderophore receptor [Pseudomonas sp. PDM11]MBD9399576.1 TonB-dependent siderophore receptor [Pseudomonas sp. PDM11]
MSKAEQGAGRFQLKCLAVVIAAACHGVAYAEQAAETTEAAELTLPAQTITGEQDRPQGPDYGYKAEKSLTASKTSTPLSETPRSVSVVTRKRIEDQKSQSLTDVLGYVPGIFAPPFAAGDGLAGDLFYIRGYNATDYGYGLLRDGLRVQGNRYDTTSEPYGLERVEVFRGPTSILYGENAPGGLVNLVSKRPTEYSRGEVQLSYGSNDRRQLNVDVSGPLNDSGNVLGRVVMVGREADTQVDHVQDNRIYIAPSLTLNFDDFNSLTLLSTYQKDRTKLELGLPAAGTLLRNPNGKIDKDTFLGNKDWNTFEREVWTLGYEFTHRFNDDWQFRQNSRYMQSRIQRNEIWPGSLNNSGFGTTVSTTAYDRHNKSIAYSLDNQLEGKFDTGAVQHTLLVGASFDRTSFNQDWSAGFGESINVYDPSWSAEPTTPYTVQNSQLDQQMAGLYSQIQSKYENWIFLLGGRFDSVDSQYRNKRDASSPFSNAESDLDYTDRDFTWQTGVMYQFENGLSPYVSYSTAFVPVQQTANDGQPLDPITAEQYEVGLKYELKGWNTMFTAAVFDLRKENDVYLEGTEFRQVGESRSKGVELEVSSDINANLNVTAAYTYTDARITKDVPGSLLEGHQMTGVPRNQASIWANYRFLDGALRGLRLGGGVRHFDSTFSYESVYGKLDTGDVTLVDAAIGYDIDENWSVDLNAKNVFDQEYVAGCNNAGRCYWGDERTFLGSVSLRW